MEERVMMEMTENKRFTYDSKQVAILKDGEFWLDGNIDTACNHSEICKELNELHDEKQSVIDWIDRKIEEIKPYNSELCRATLLELKEFLE